MQAKQVYAQNNWVLENAIFIDNLLVDIALNYRAIGKADSSKS